MAAAEAKVPGREDFGLKPGLEGTRWASEPMLANPLAISFDEQGRLLVVETHRLRTSSLDVRDYPELIERDLASRTIQDRAALIEEAFGEQAGQLGIEADRLRLLEDANHDGVADRSEVLATNAAFPAQGIASGVLAWHNDVWIAQAPSLSKIGRGAAGAGSREELMRGFGVHIGFAGHGMQGPVVGPDGKLYFSVGDQGSRLERKDGTVVEVLDSGAIFRCHPDGSGLEVLATGLRNPGDLAFDEWGNLFTADSASGAGDRARFVHVIEGGDSGWRIGYQHAPKGGGGPWISEGLWKPHSGGQPAYFQPPIGNIEPGPAGLAYDPGSGLTPDSRGRFFLCHFNHNPADSGIRTYRLKMQGAGFDLAESEVFLRGAMPTDVTFGPDGRLYFSDWVTGWPSPKSGRGRIYAVGTSGGEGADAAAGRHPLEPAVAAIAGFPPNRLVGLLGHADRRVRQAAQFALVARGESSLPLLEAVATDVKAGTLARLHALWGMGQLADRVAPALNGVPALLRDPEREVRAQAAKVLGDAFRFEAFLPLRAALRDPEPRVVFFAAQSLGKLRRQDAVPALIEVLQRNDEQDDAVQQAAVIAIARLGGHPALADVVKHPSRAVRMGVLVACRRMGDPLVAEFLEDFDPAVVREAAIAINDRPMDDLLPALAALLDVAPLDDGPLVLRALNAHFRLGGPDNAKALAAFAARAYVPASHRAEALRLLALWGKPPARDRITGLHRPLPPREAGPASEALGEFLSQLSGKIPEEVQVATIEAVQELGVPGTGHALWDIVYQPTYPVAARIAALLALEKLDDLRLEVAAQHAGRSDRVALRLAALPVLARRHPAVSTPVFAALAPKGTAAEQRMIFKYLQDMAHPRADEILLQAMQRLASGEVPLEAQAELLDAAEARSHPELAARLAKLKEAWRAGADRLAPYRSALAGGDPAGGRRVFERDPRVSCMQCHEPGGRSGGGAPLDGIGRVRTAEELLEAVLFSEGHRATPRDFGQILARGELRDLVAYLSTLREPATFK